MIDSVWGDVSYRLAIGGRRGVRIGEIPVTVKRRRNGESKKGNSLMYGLNFARVLLKTWFR